MSITILFSHWEVRLDLVNSHYNSNISQIGLLKYTKIVQNSWNFLR